MYQKYGKPNPPRFRNVDEILKLFRNDLKGRSLSEVLSDKEKIDEWLGPNGRIFQLVELLHKSIKMAQIRKFFDPIRQLENVAKKNIARRRGEESEIGADEYLKLRTWLAMGAYNVGRGVIPREFFELMKILVASTKTYRDIIKLVDIFNAIIAYHTYIDKVYKKR